jgi:hypothetical protein
MYAGGPIVLEKGHVSAETWEFETITVFNENSYRLASSRCPVYRHKLF